VVEAELAGERAVVALVGVAAEEQAVVAQVEVAVQAVELEPGQAVAAGLELEAVWVQGQALVRVREPRSVLAQMHP
jgi:hypothetical protein